MKDLIIQFLDGYIDGDFSHCTDAEMAYFVDLGWIMDGKATAIGHEVAREYGQ